MRIAICDIDDAYRKYIKKIIYKYTNSRKMEVCIDEYCSGENLLSSKIKYSLIILGYFLKDTNGYETAKKLRLKGDNCAIIFISSNTEFIVNAFKVNPYRFLVKPINETVLCRTLEEFFISKNPESPVWIRNGDNTLCIKINDIFYLEADNKNCYIQLQKEKIHCKKTMGSVYSILPKNNFCKINRSFVVNFNYIDSFNNDRLILTNGDNLHISRSYYKSFKNEFYNFSEPFVV